MKKIKITFFILFLVAFLFGDRPDLTIWQNIRNSAYTSDNTIHIRCETIENPFASTDIYYRQSDQWLLGNMELLQGLTSEAILSADPAQDLYCRLKTGNDSLTAMMPAFIELDNQTDIENLSFVNADAQEDTLATAPSALDIYGIYSGFSDERLYAGITNDGFGFPLNSGGIFPDQYYLYIAAVANPETALEDSVVYGMVYSQIPFLLESGLYRIVGTQFDLETFTPIADITTSIQDSLLLMSCSFDDLTEDEYFGDWPSLSNALALDVITMQITLPTDIELVDFSMPSLQFIDKIYIPSSENTLPILSNIYVEPQSANFIVHVDYFDNESHFPLIAELILDNSDSYPLIPQSLDFSQTVQFVADVPVIQWESMLIHFSDDGSNWVEGEVNQTSSEDEAMVIDLSCRIFPNPFNPSTLIEFESSFDDVVDLKIFNSKGQLVRTLCAERPVQCGTALVVNWDGVDDNQRAVSTGIYHLRITGQRANLSKKMILLK